jgi:hypothetical protein
MRLIFPLKHIVKLFISSAYLPTYDFIYLLLANPGFSLIGCLVIGLLNYRHVEASLFLAWEYFVVLSKEVPIHNIKVWQVGHLLSYRSQKGLEFGIVSAENLMELGLQLSFLVDAMERSVRNGFVKRY